MKIIVSHKHATIVTTQLYNCPHLAVQLMGVLGVGFFWVYKLSSVLSTVNMDVLQAAGFEILITNDTNPFCVFIRTMRALQDVRNKSTLRNNISAWKQNVIEHFCMENMQLHFKLRVVEKLCALAVAVKAGYFKDI